jgi:hypothetical protein
VTAPQQVTPKGPGETSRSRKPGRRFLRNKKQEWEEYRSEVTAFERRKNLRNL